MGKSSGQIDGYKIVCLGSVMLGIRVEDYEIVKEGVIIWEGCLEEEMVDFCFRGKKEEFIR